MPAAQKMNPSAAGLNKAALSGKVRCLQEILQAHSPLLVAYSGGVDSATLLAVACATPGVEVCGILADSPSLPRHALARALDEARVQGWPVEVLHTNEMEDARYAANPLNRCYYCKAELFARMEAYAKEKGFRILAYGENADDLAADRPGSRAAAEFCVLAPLRQAGLGKAEVRQLARERHLSMAEAPAEPCLSSRLRHGVPVTPEALALVETAEALLHQKGYRILRVRHLGNEIPGGGPGALVQVSPPETPRLLQERDALAPALRDIGFAEVSFDENGYQGPSLD
jgi:uncharacterized protein